MSKRWGYVVITVTFLSLVALALTLAQQTANNTSACSGVSDPVGNWGYCNGNFASFSAASSESLAEDQTINPIPGHMSPLPLSDLFYPGNTIKFIADYQAWFCTTGPPGPYDGHQVCTAANEGSHKMIGYSENNPATIAAQVSFMQSIGISAISPDWYGTSTSQSFLQNTTLAIGNYLATLPGHLFKLFIMLDGGALKAGTSSLAGCPQNGTDQTTCLINNINADLVYIQNKWGQTGYYLQDSTGANLVSFFVTQGGWTGGTDWTTIMNAVCLNINGFSPPMKLIKETNTSETCFQGAYSWVAPPVYSNTTDGGFGCGSAGCMQYCNDSTTCGASYLDTFYTNGRTSGRVIMGETIKGFNWANASWGSQQKIVAQQCGQTLLMSAAKPAANGWGTSHQLPFVQLVTWNDYEEGTEQETGILNCYSISETLSSYTIHWSLAANDSHATLATIHHYTVWRADPAGNLTVVANNVCAGNVSGCSNSYNLMGLLPAGTWRIYTEMVGMPLIIDQVSNGVTVTTAPPVSAPPGAVYWFFAKLRDVLGGGHALGS
jgi:hypothetical protein